MDEWSNDFNLQLQFTIKVQQTIYSLNERHFLLCSVEVFYSFDLHLNQLNPSCWNYSFFSSYELRLKRRKGLQRPSKFLLRILMQTNWYSGTVLTI